MHLFIVVSNSCQTRSIVRTRCFVYCWVLNAWINAWHLLKKKIPIMCERRNEWTYLFHRFLDFFPYLPSWKPKSWHFQKLKWVFGLLCSQCIDWLRYIFPWLSDEHFHFLSQFKPWKQICFLTIDHTIHMLVTSLISKAHYFFQNPY